MEQIYKIGIRAFYSRIAMCMPIMISFRENRIALTLQNCHVHAYYDFAPRKQNCLDVTSRQFCFRGTKLQLLEQFCFH